MIIDVHGHLISQVEDLDWIVKSGIVKQVWLLGLPKSAKSPDLTNDPVVFGGDDEVLEVARKYPGFFLPFGYLDFRLEPSNIDAQHESGFVGLKAIYPAKPYDDPSYMPYYERAAALKMPILFHTGGLGPISSAELGEGMSPRAGNMHPYQLGTICGEFPDLVCVGAHLGNSFQSEILECMRCFPNLYFDISGGDTVLVMRWLLSHLGEPTVMDKLLMGIDSVYGRREYHENIIEKVRFWTSFFRYTGDWFEWTDQAQKILHLNAEAIHQKLNLLR